MINSTEQIETITFQALAHPSRRTILRIIHSRSQGITYTELLTELGISTGKLNYHLEQLKGLIEKSSSQNYILTSFGKKAIQQINLIEQTTSPEDEKYVKIASLSQRVSLQPIVRAFLSISIALAAVLVAVWGYLTYILFVEGAPIFVFFVLPVLLAAGVALLVTLLHALVKTPAWIKRFEQRFFCDN